MTGEKCYTIKNYFSLKLCKKREIKKPKKKQTKSRKIREIKNEAKWKQSKKCIEEIYQGNYEKKRFIQSFKPREKILKLKIKVKNLQ